MDIWSREKRSEVMSLIRSKNTKPEYAIRSMLHRMGYRFRLHRRDLPGCPDIVLPKHEAVIFVNGCFWHKHANCRDGKIPRTNKFYWGKKLEKNVKRQKKNVSELKKQGWKSLVIWECEIKLDLDNVQEKVERFLQI